MFVKIVRPNVIQIGSNEDGLRAVRHKTYERTIECEDFSVEDLGDRVIVGCQPDKGTFSLEKKPGYEVYVLNNQGDTVHTYRWKEGR